MKLFIISLRRSGSTIFWKTFRQDKNLTCYDEPFVNLLINLPKLNRKQTTHEFIELLNKNPSNFWKFYSPIDSSQEISERMSVNQKQYLQYLANSAEHTVCDLTRCCFKIKELKNIFPQAYIIHLYRSPHAFVSSHILPNKPEVSKIKSFVIRMKNYLNRYRFWSVKSGYSSWGYERIISASDNSLFSTYLRENNLFINDFNNLPAYGKLMYFWKICYEKVEKDGRYLYKNRFISLPFEKFCENPGYCMKKIYKNIGLELPKTDYKNIKNPNMGYKPNHVNWMKMAEKIGLPPLYQYPWNVKL